MSFEEITERFHIGPEHFETKKLETPVLEPGVYNILGKQLFELYQKYEVSWEDQRKIEGLVYLLESSARHRREEKLSSTGQRVFQFIKKIKGDA